jgi:transposase InsO family protein
MSCVFKISRSGYYRFRRATPPARRVENMRLLEKIKTIHRHSRQVYGSLRMQGELCSRRRVARLMRTVGLQAKMKRRFKVTTQVDLLAKKSPNLLQQNFVSEKPNQRWVTYRQ